MEHKIFLFLFHLLGLMIWRIQHQNSLPVLKNTAVLNFENSNKEYYETFQIVRIEVKQIWVGENSPETCNINQIFENHMRCIKKIKKYFT